MRRSGSILFTLAALAGLGLSSHRPGAAAVIPLEQIVNQLVLALARGKIVYLSEKTVPANGPAESAAIAATDDDPNVVGWITFTGNAVGITPAIWLNGASTATLLPGHPFGEAISINNKARVTGTLFINQAPQVFSWTQAKGLEMLGPGFGLFVNDSDEVFGAEPDNHGSFRAAEWVKPGQPPVILDPNGGVSSSVITGDDYGNAAGSGSNADGSTFAFEYFNGKYTRLPGLGGRNASVYGMNNLGIVAGAATLADGTSQSVYWDPAGGVHNLKVPGNTAALAVADNGVVLVSMSDGLHLMALSTPGVIGPPLGIFATPEFLGIGGPFHSRINQFGDVIGVVIVNGNDYHAVISSPQSAPLPAAAITSVGAALQSASDLVTKLQKSAAPGTPSFRWLGHKARLYANVNQILPLQRGQSPLSPQQTGEIIYALSSSLALDTQGGPNAAPDPSVVSPAQLQQLRDADTQALTAAG